MTTADQMKKNGGNLGISIIEWFLNAKFSKS